MRISDWSSDVCSSDLLERQSDELRDARDVGAEEVRIAEHVVHQRAAMDDMVDPPGKAVDVLRVQPEAGLGDVPHDDLELVFRKVGKVSRYCRVRRVAHAQAILCSRMIGRPDQAYKLDGPSFHAPAP